MSEGGRISFAGFLLDPTTRQLRYRGAERPLRAKSLAVLLYLVRHPNRLVTRRELFRTVWPRTSVSSTVLRVCINEVRAALGEEGRGFLTTVPRRGYRFALETVRGDGSAATFVGRRRETALLHEAFARVRDGSRQVVFLAGEAGAGKTALIERFLDDVRCGGSVRIARGQCFQLHGKLEPYAPVFDLLNRLCDEADGERIVQTLTQWAPSWVFHMPGRIDGTALEAVRRGRLNPNPNRMLRELGEALENLAHDAPLVLVLADLQWSDVSTADALAYLAQHKTASRLLVVGSYRTGDTGGDNPFGKTLQHLRARGLCTEISLDRLAPAEVEEYLVRRLAGYPLDARVVQTVQRYSDGHPLFLVAMVDHLLELGRLAPCDGVWQIDRTVEGIVPEAAELLVANVLEALAAGERRVLSAASVVGPAFAAAPVAAASGLPIDTVEEICGRLARGGRLMEVGVETWPDGTVSGRYEFGHAIYAEALYGKLTALSRARLHRAVAERIEAGHSGRIGDVAALLARHFTLAGDVQRAAHLHAEAAKAARDRFAAPETIAHWEAALTLLRSLPATRDRSRTELHYLRELGGAMLAAHGYSSPQVVAIHQRASDLARRLGDEPSQIMAMSGQYTYQMMRANLRSARHTAEAILTVAGHQALPLFMVIGHTLLGTVLFNLGEFAAAREHLVEASAARNPCWPRLPIDQPTLYLGMLALTLLVLGHRRPAGSALRQMIDHTAALSDDPFNLAYAHCLAAQFYAIAADRGAARRDAAQALALATEHGFILHRATAMVVCGWADGDVTAIREGLSLKREIEHQLGRSFLEALLAETLLDQGDIETALATVEEALAFAEDSGEVRHLPELHRLRGECLLRRRGRHARGARSAQASFRRALKIAERQKAQLWERHAATALRAATARHAEP